MASTNIDRTAIVNLAVINEITVGSELSSINFELKDQVHDFSYSVISDNDGDSYVFKIELINFNDDIHKALASSFGFAMKHNSDSKHWVDSETSLEAFPDLLIQWGYPDSLSNTHIAKISDIKYKFTQAKEKILIIEAVNAGNWADAFWRNTTITHTNAAMSTRDNTTIFQNKTVSDIILTVIQGALKSIKGVEVDSNIDVSVSGSLEKEYSNIIKLFYADIYKNRSDIVARAMAMDRDYGAEMGHKYKFEAIKRFFKFLGFGVENTLFIRESTTEGDTEETKAEKAASRAINNQKAELYYPIQKSIPTEDTGGYGTYTEFIPASQLKDTSKIENLDPAFENAAKSNLEVPFNAESDPGMADQISAAVGLYNGRNPDNLINIQDVVLNVNLDTKAQNILKSGGVQDGTKTGLGTIFRASAQTSTGPIINFLPYMRTTNSTLLLDIPSTAVVAGKEQSIQGNLHTLDYEVHKAKDDLANSEVFHDAQLNKYDTDSVKDKAPVDYDSLPPSVRARLLYSNLKIGLYTNSNESVLDVVKNVIKKLNILVEHADNLISLREHSPSIPPHELSFSDILVQTDQALPTTKFTFSKGSNNDKSLQGKLREVNCFPSLQLKGDDSKPLNVNTVELSYGKSTSIVKYFDFAGDIRYLANMAAAGALDQNLESSYEYLTTDSILTIVPVIQALINSEVFRTELQAKFKSENIIIDKLELLRDQIKDTYTPEVKLSDDVNIDMRFFEQLGFINEFLSTPQLPDFENIVAKNENRAPTFNDKQFTTAQVFFQVLATDMGTALFFTKKTKDSEKNTLTELLKKESEGLNYSAPAKTYVYSLKRNNIFDNFGNITNQLEKDQEGQKISAREMRLALSTQFKNKTEPWSIIIKTLGIPEMDTLDEITTPRVFDFTVHDLSREAQTEGNTHWLSGTYRPLAINHKINNSVGYISEFSLLKDVYID